MLTRRRNHVRMLSPATLTAFSSGVAQSSFGRTGPVQHVRSVGAQPTQPAAPTAQPALASPSRTGDAEPGRPLPRGSLLDLSV
jgi:hypothetical protein